MWVCKIKNLPHQLIVVDPAKGETRKGEFPQKFLARTIPAIDDNGHLLFESSAILIYLAEKYQWTDLYPNDVVIRSKINQYLHWHHHNSRMMSKFVFRPKLWQALGLPATLPSKEDDKTVIGVLKMLDLWLKDSKYLVGNELTLADFACICEFDQLYELKLMDLTTYPNLWRWIEDMKKVPYYEEAHSTLRKLSILFQKSKL
uniref:Glutathione transferase n=1 Tax=Arcella intermedia TaxID=1963864 RepID=A0A6B2LHW3_9EUKA